MSDRYKDKIKADIFDTSPEYEAILRGQNNRHETGAARIKDQMRASVFDTSIEHEAILREQKKEARSSSGSSSVSREYDARDERQMAVWFSLLVKFAVGFTVYYVLNALDFDVQWMGYLLIPLFFHWVWQTEKAAR